MTLYESYEDMPKINNLSQDDIFISDSTIRDGSQMPGIVMTREFKIKCYEYLHKIGIEKVEAFVFNKREIDAVKTMLDIGYECPVVTGWARAVPADIDKVLAVDGLHETGILMSVSDSHIFAKMRLSGRQQAEEKYLNALQYAVDHGLKTRAHLEDMTRADNPGFTYPLVKKILEIDPNCIIRICDTVGYGLPFEQFGEPYSVPSMVQSLKKIGAKNIETHIHDDYGLGAANSLSGYLAGANWTSVTFLGIGERAGNTGMEKILLFLADRVEGFKKYNLSCLTEFAHYMEKSIGIKLPSNKPVVGRNVFAHESGIHASGVLKNPFIYEAYPPELVGGERFVLLGDSSGLDSVKHKVEETMRELLNIDIKINKTDPRLKKIQDEIQSLYDNELRTSCISDEELVYYVEKYFLNRPIREGEEEVTF
ncbi:isopropylmalate synthase [Methanolapillus millepedarum]|uniref:Citrate (Re)-synthase n=1 Tax=Methanolapillus millepedarum TaxID=3028296 RepID=A0AA96ZUQ9_9EURY|nr:Citrate (Re)-synthase [Methanosarcinaceae archaeon Ac7]